MEAERFDALSRRIGSRTSRRLAVALAATGLLSLAVPEVAAARCSRRKPCPACKTCRKRRCRPDATQDGEPCATGKICQNGVCTLGCANQTCSASGCCPNASNVCNPSGQCCTPFSPCGPTSCVLTNNCGQVVNCCAQAGATNPGCENNACCEQTVSQGSFCSATIPCCQLSQPGSRSCVGGHCCVNSGFATATASQCCSGKYSFGTRCE